MFAFSHGTSFKKLPIAFEDQRFWKPITNARNAAPKRTIPLFSSIVSGLAASIATLKTENPQTDLLDGIFNFNQNLLCNADRDVPNVP